MFGGSSPGPAGSGVPGGISPAPEDPAAEGGREAGSSGVDGRSRGSRHGSGWGESIGDVTSALPTVEMPDTPPSPASPRRNEDATAKRRRLFGQVIVGASSGPGARAAKRPT
ncbi:hypothetical protein Pta02_62950 [Planobispora takensis]|uniref:Uncharacterized protein n=1 Tax=Planobispora takensis TaxID=1367882 RepID=A0A8J3T321_9ACTN|nr:hypothetical protein Pta02_62950 [Planobispora takensis]